MRPLSARPVPPANTTDPTPPAPCGLQDAQGLLAALQATGMGFGEALAHAMATVGRAEPFRPEWEAFLTLEADRIRTAEPSDRPAREALAVLDQVATHAPATANAWLAEALRRGVLTRPEGGVFTTALANRPWITSLPEGLAIEGCLDLDGCVALTALPLGLRVNGALWLRFCLALTALPDGLVAGNTLALNGCSALRYLPEGLTVRGNLGLDGCLALERLPSGLRVGTHTTGNLDLRGCSAWDRVIPADAAIAGRIYTDHYAHGVRLGFWRKANPSGRQQG
jgi:hypothetical protein